MTRLGALLRLSRSVHHVSLTAMADEMGMTRRQLSAIELDRSGSLPMFAKVLVWLLAQEPITPPQVVAPPTLVLQIDGERIAAAAVRSQTSPAPEDVTDAPGAPDPVADAVAE
jgi:transcriptional regulator with XRE-family HTH domain